MEAELKAIKYGKESFKEFIIEYFNANYDADKMVYINAQGEILNQNTAMEFYEDYLNSGLSMMDYIRETWFVS